MKNNFPDVAHPLLLVGQDEADPLAQLVVALHDGVGGRGLQGKDNVEHGDGRGPLSSLVLAGLQGDGVAHKPHIVHFEFEFGSTEIVRDSEHVGQGFVGEADKISLLYIRRFVVHPENKALHSEFSE